ncbi:hypothetical protein K488DRAFT_48543, partial [Vararia minispora EC-137]
RSADDMWVHDMHESSLRSAGAQGAGTRSVPSGPPTAQLLVSNLHYEVTTKDLASVFGQIGTLVREPHIRYDKSGRSTGVAIVTLETPAEATRAKNQFHGQLAKGQPMTIDYFREAPRRRNSDPVGGSPTLLKRIEKAPLLERLSKAEAAVAARGAAPVAAARGAVSRRGKAPPSGPKPKKERAKPKTAQELDSELDAFMGSEKPAVPAVAKDANGDVEMA